MAKITMNILTRRGFLGSMLALGAAPAIVRADSLMRIVPLRPNGIYLPIYYRDLSERNLEQSLIECVRAVDTQGLRIGIQPTKLYIHPSRYAEAVKVVRNVLQVVVDPNQHPAVWKLSQ